MNVVALWVTSLLSDGIVAVEWEILCEESKSLREGDLAHHIFNLLNEASLSPSLLHSTFVTALHLKT